ncbi:MAG: hypothetical protein OXD48_10695 [Litoreibacter sp.]|nr:hypothetical protein [Litoreibacter sp.]
MNDGRRWFDAFVAKGPDYPALRQSGAELQALLLKAGLGAGLPLGHAQDLSALAKLLASDPQLIAMAAAALVGPHYRARLEGTEEHVVVEKANILMTGPVLIDALVAGAKRAVLYQIDWPLLLWPMLSHAHEVYGLTVSLEAATRETVTITVGETSGLDKIGPPQPVPVDVIERLQAFAAKTYVPASEASRASGAGAGISDND